MRFCPYCGAPVVPAGKFCVECGRQLDRPSAGGIKGLHLTAAFVGVFLAMLLVGMLVVYLIVPGTQRQVSVASAPSGSAPAAQGQQGDQSLPPGHPALQLPAEARSFIDQVEKEAHAKPNDIAAWDKLGEVALRAAMIDPSYYPKAEDAYGHALKLNPDNPDALRGVGNLNYDHKNYDQAIAAYEHYLKARPNDPEVRTDLGTMYLYTGNPDQAVVQYKHAVQAKPDFFEAYFNMGIAYGAMNNPDEARKALGKALALAPDDATRSKVNETLAKLSSGSQVASAAGTKARTGQSSGGARGSATSDTKEAEDGGIAKGSSGGFHGAVEDMVRHIEFMGDKVQSVDWPEAFKATVRMDNFPMDQMPPVAKQKFLNDLKEKIRSAKTAHNVTSTVVVDIADGATGRVMESVSQ